VPWVLKYDFTGQKIGKWRVIQRATTDGNRETRWLCRCDCGNESRVTTTRLRDGHSKSCRACSLLGVPHPNGRKTGTARREVYAGYSGPHATEDLNSRLQNNSSKNLLPLIVSTAVTPRPNKNVSKAGGSLRV